MNSLERARHVLKIESEEIERLAARLDHHFEKAITLLRETTERRGKIVILGVGKSGHIGDKIAATLTSTGTPAVVLNSLNALHGDLGVICDGDLLLLLSYSGETAELLNLLPSLAHFDARRIAITGNLRSTLAQSSDVVLDVSVLQEACPHNLAPTSSTTVMMALGDALAMVLLEARGFTREDFARFHPAGRLGHSILLRVRKMMRPLSEVVAMQPTALVLDVLKELNKKRLGAAILVHPDGTLAGIFTHGDFVRHFTSDPQIEKRSVSEVMITSPITIDQDKLAPDVLAILEHHRIEDLVVLDEQQKVVGLIDSQDLFRWRVL
ncbi:MAG: KpsF/GutQ family sugar-phosphate isomerase [Chthoniobacterales bacterium]|nr:KpsF/GutQ family sugar-phosphate isomerase [Chthoniobacterales bacterium]